MKHGTKLTIIASIAVLTGCATMEGRGVMQEKYAGAEEQGMSQRNPADVINQLVKAINEGNLDAAAACYDAQAVFVVEPGQVTTGTKALRDALAGFIAMKITITAETYKVVQTGDLALYIAKWNAVGTAPDGAPVKLCGTSSDVLRRQADGRWLIAIDNPFGVAILN